MKASDFDEMALQALKTRTDQATDLSPVFLRSVRVLQSLLSDFNQKGPLVDQSAD